MHFAENIQIDLSISKIFTTFAGSYIIRYESNNYFDFGLGRNRLLASLRENTCEEKQQVFIATHRREQANEGGWNKLCHFAGQTGEK